MQELSFEREALGLPISVTLSGSGNDTLVKIRGGSAPEIGSVSVAYCDGGEPVLRTLLRPGSRDDVVSDMFAERLSRKLGSTITAVCCIRCTAGGEGDSAVLECTRELLDDVAPAAETKSGPVRCWTGPLFMFGLQILSARTRARRTKVTRTKRETSVTPRRFLPATGGAA